MAEISMSGDGGVAGIRVDGEQQQVFHRSAMLLMGGMSKGSRGNESDGVGGRGCQVVISPRVGGVGPDGIRSSDYEIIA